MFPVFEVTEERRDPVQRSVKGLSTVTSRGGTHGRPKLLDESLVLGNFRNSRYTGPSSGLLIIERHVHVGVVLEFIKLVGGIIRDEKQIELRRFNRWYVVEPGQG